MNWKFTGSLLVLYARGQMVGPFSLGGHCTPEPRDCVLGKSAVNSSSRDGEGRGIHLSGSPDIATLITGILDLETWK